MTATRHRHGCTRLQYFQGFTDTLGQRWTAGTRRPIVASVSRRSRPQCYVPIYAAQPCCEPLASDQREKRAQHRLDQMRPEVEAQEVEDGDAAGEDDGIDTLAALGLPVDVGEAQQERELVQDERGA